MGKLVQKRAAKTKKAQRQKDTRRVNSKRK